VLVWQVPPVPPVPPVPQVQPVQPVQQEQRAQSGRRALLGRLLGRQALLPGRRAQRG
jgi:hypothetical protein